MAIKVYEVDHPLTPKQEKWIQEYIKCNDLTTASRNAGYKGVNNERLRSIGYQNSIRFKNIIPVRRQEANNEVKGERIAELSDIFEFWTKVFNDENNKQSDRLKASELLAKAKGGFIEKREVKVVDTDWFIEDN